MSSEAEIVDLRGLKCPLPVMRARKRFETLDSGTLAWIETTDPLAAIDIPAFLAEDGHALLATEPQERGHRFLVRRG